MVGTRAAARLLITDGQRAGLEAIVGSPSLPHRAVRQAQGLLDAADGVANEEIGRRCGVSANTVRAWRKSFAQRGVAGVGVVAEGRGRRPWLPEGMVAEVVRVTLTEKPADGSTQWSTRTLAKQMGISHGAVANIWRDHGLQPWRVDTFKLSTDSRFEEKLVDVVGLYLDPPEKAVVFSVDEKSQIQALDRTQPGLPMKPGRCGTMTHDYKRNGTTTLFAALNVGTGEVVGECMSRHRHDEFLTFLRRLDRRVPEELDLHVIVDNYATHKHATVRDWLERHPRVHLHFTPTSSSWLNQVERWFKHLTDRRLRRGVFTSVPALIEAITTWVEHGNADPQPFIWHAKAERHHRQGPPRPNHSRTSQIKDTALARREGVREEPACKASQEIHRLQPGGYGPECGARPSPVVGGRVTPVPGEVAGREVTRKACGVLVAMPQGQSWAPTPSTGDVVNVGSVPGWSRRPGQSRSGAGRFVVGWSGRDVAEPS